MKTPKVFFLVILSLFPLLVHGGEGDCSYDEDAGRDKHKAFVLKLAALFAILVAGATGVCIPLLGKSVSALRPENGLFFILKSFGAGVILSTGFIHILPDSFENLTSPCLSNTPWQKFPFAGFVAMVAAIGTLMVDTLATGFHSKSRVSGELKGVEEGSGGDAGCTVQVHTHAMHGHAHGPISASERSPELIRQRVISQVLEIGILVHSVIIGVSLGASESPSTIKPLVIALSFHQLFEGMGLGGCIVQAEFKARSRAAMALFFSLTTPVGIAAGIGLSAVYNENSPTALIVEGLLNSAAAGILIYMALVDLLAADFMNPRVMSNRKLQLGINTAMLLGAGLMSLLAMWA